MPRVWVCGKNLEVEEASSVLSALQNAGHLQLRRSLSGERRGALCGMGVCFECRVRVDGALRRACQTPVQEGQRIELLEVSHD